MIHCDGRGSEVVEDLFVVVTGPAAAAAALVGVRYVVFGMDFGPTCNLAFAEVEEERTVAYFQLGPYRLVSFRMCLLLSRREGFACTTMGSGTLAETLAETGTRIEGLDWKSLDCMFLEHMAR